MEIDRKVVDDKPANSGTSYILAAVGDKVPTATKDGHHGVPHPEKGDNKDEHSLKTREETEKLILETKIVDDVDPETGGKTKLTEKIMSQMRDKFGIGKESIEGGGGDPHPEINLEKKNNVTIKGAWDSMFGKAKAMERELDHVTRKPVSSESLPVSNVEKLSPFSGPTDDDSARALASVSSHNSEGVYSTEVKAPGIWTRTKEELEAVGEAIKEIVAPKK